MITIRRKPLGFQSLRKPQTLGMRLLSEGVQRVQTRTIQRLTPTVDVNAPGAGNVTDYADYADYGDFADQGDGANYDGYDQGSGDAYTDALQSAIRNAEAPDPSARPSARPASGVQRSPQRGAPPPNRQAAPPRPAPPQRQGSAPAQRPAGNQTVQRQPAPPTPPAQPSAPPPAGIFRRQQLTEGDNMPTDLRSIMAIHQQRAQQPAEPAAPSPFTRTSGIFDTPAKPSVQAKPSAQRSAPVQRSMTEEAASFSVSPAASVDDDVPRPRRRGKIIDVTPPKKGLPFGDDPVEVPSSASPLGAPIQREARNAENLPPRPAPLPVTNRSRETSTPGAVHRETDEGGGSDDEPGRGPSTATSYTDLRRPDDAFDAGIPGPADRIAADTPDYTGNASNFSPGTDSSSSSTLTSDNFADNFADQPLDAVQASRDDASDITAEGFDDGAPYLFEGAGAEFTADGVTMRDIDTDAIQAAIRAAEGPTADRPVQGTPNVARRMADTGDNANQGSASKTDADADSMEPQAVQRRTVQRRAVQRHTDSSTDEAGSANALDTGSDIADIPDTAVLDAVSDDGMDAPIQRYPDSVQRTQAEAPDQASGSGDDYGPDDSDAGDLPWDGPTDGSPDDFGGGPGSGPAAHPSRDPSSGSGTVARAYQPPSDSSVSFSDRGNAEIVDNAASQTSAYQDQIDAAIRRAEGPTPPDTTGLTDDDSGAVVNSGASLSGTNPGSAAAPVQRAPGQSNVAPSRKPTGKEASKPTSKPSSETSAGQPSDTSPSAPTMGGSPQSAQSGTAARGIIQPRRDDNSQSSLDQAADRTSDGPQAAPGAPIRRHLAGAGTDAVPSADPGITAYGSYNDLQEESGSGEAEWFADQPGEQAPIQRMPDFDTPSGYDGDEAYQVRLQDAIRRAESPAPADEGTGADSAPVTQPTARGTAPTNMAPTNTAQRSFTEIPMASDASDIDATYNAYDTYDTYDTNDADPQYTADMPYQDHAESAGFAGSADPIGAPIQRTLADDLPFAIEDGYADDASDASIVNDSYVDDHYADDGNADSATYTSFAEQTDSTEAPIQRLYTDIQGGDFGAAEADYSYQESIEDAIRRAESPASDSGDWSQPGDNALAGGTTPGGDTAPGSGSSSPVQRSPRGRRATSSRAQRSVTDAAPSGNASTGAATEGGFGDFGAPRAYQQSVEDAIRRAEGPTPPSITDGPMQGPRQGDSRRGTPSSMAPDMVDTTSNTAQRSPVDSSSAPSAPATRPGNTRPSVNQPTAPAGYEDGLFLSGDVFDKPNSLNEDAGIYRTAEEIDLIQRVYDGRSDEPLYFDYASESEDYADAADVSYMVDPYASDSPASSHVPGASNASNATDAQSVQRYPSAAQGYDYADSAAEGYDPYADYLASTQGADVYSDQHTFTPDTPNRPAQRTVQRSPERAPDRSLRLPPTRRNRPASEVARDYQPPGDDTSDSMDITAQPVDLAQALGFTTQTPGYQYVEADQPGADTPYANDGYDYGDQGPGMAAGTADGALQRAYDDSAPSATENELLQLIGLPPGTAIGRGRDSFSIGESASEGADDSSDYGGDVGGSEGSAASSVQRTSRESQANRRVMRSPNRPANAVQRGQDDGSGVPSLDLPQNAQRTQQVEKLAQAVYKIIKARLKTERERQQGRK